MGNKSSRKDDEVIHRRIYVGDVPEIITSETNFTEGEVQKETPKKWCGKSKVTTGGKADKKRQKFSNNLIISSKYTAWNFIPKNLYQQFRRVVNAYFLCMAVVQSVVDSPVSPVTAAAPLVFVIVVTALKQGYEDWLRHKADENVNNRPVHIVENGQLITIKSKDLKVGDIIKLLGDEQVPADIVVLGSSDEFLRCQVTTANLDGETNLKIRYCPAGLPHIKDEIQFPNLHFILECEQPNADLYQFNGVMLIPPDKLMRSRGSLIDTALTSEETSTMVTPNVGSIMDHGLGASDPHLSPTGSPTNQFFTIVLTIDNMLLRGSRVKNTDFVFGLVVYTGDDTRLAQNSKKTSNKFSTVEKSVNAFLMFFIVLLFCTVCISTGVHYFYKDMEHMEEAWYVELQPRDQSAAITFINVFTAFLILFNYIIPISLYVTMEMQKFIGSMFFVWDKEMICPYTNQPPLCNTSDLNEELGQIEYLFTDKTGTLTENIMQFRYASIHGKRYDFVEEELHLLREGESQSEMINLQDNKEVVRFLVVLALCHSVQLVPMRRPSVDSSNPTFLESFAHSGKNKKISAKMKAASSLFNLEHGGGILIGPGGKWEYQASSPDEKALLEACYRMGVIYNGEKEDVLTVEMFGETHIFKRHLVLEFDADRKCMSVIVEDSKGQIYLLTKGAETAVIPRCDIGPTQKTMKNVVDFALMGMRTLVVAEKQIGKEELNRIVNQLKAARRLLKGREEKMRELYREIESHLTVLGATGVEDQLQDGVLDTLQSLGAAGIRVWMLTGDKLETGVNVAVACGLITPASKQLIVTNHTEMESIIRRLEEIKSESIPDDNTTFVIDGESLATAFKYAPDLLREVAMSAFRVVCCRMAPLQKAQVVHMVKTSRKKPITAAVGDGANDVAMIQEAHIGIGIFGKEGRQAARCSDFALARFSFLKKAILVHGFYYYIRLSTLAIYFFYKNVVFILPQLLFCFDTAFSTQSLYEGVFLMMFNILFTSFPILIFGLLEQPHSAKTLMERPYLYKTLAKNALMNWKHFFMWIFFALFHGCSCYYIPRFSWTLFRPINDISSYGTTIFCGVIAVCNMKLAIETKFVNILYVIAQSLSYITLFICGTVYSEVNLRDIYYKLDAGNFFKVYLNLHTRYEFWFTLVAIVFVALLPDYIAKTVHENWPTILRWAKKTSARPPEYDLEPKGDSYETPNGEIPQINSIPA